MYFPSKIINITLRRDSLANRAANKDNTNCDTSWKETVLITRRGERNTKLTGIDCYGTGGC